MSWFDTAGFVSVAKSALKEAQKTIDKALDIKEDEEGSSKSATPATVSTDKNESESFFSAWGVKGNASPDRTASILPGTQDSFSSSLWGSFTGSFFENPRSTTPGGEDFSSTISEQPKRSSISRLSGGDMDGDIDTDLALGDDRSMWEGFAKTQLVVESPLTSKEDKPSSSAPSTSTSEEVKWRRKERQSDRSQNRNSYPNRLSVISSESDKRSSDSVEILGSTSCTASPESDLPTSFSASSLASSAGLRPVSASSPDSVEVIPESSESYSVSVEVLGSRSSSASLSSPLEPTPDRPILLSPKDLTSPDSVEVVPEEEEDGSLADDSYASASASESTMTQATVLEPHGQVCSAMDSSTHFLEAIDSSGQVDIVTSSTSGRTDSSLSSLVLDSSTDTIHSDHSSVSRSNLQLTVTSDYPQAPKPLWLASSQSSCEKQIQENVSNKLLASPKKSSSKSRESLNRSSEKRDWKAGEIKLLSTDSPCEDTQGAVTDSSGEGTLMESSSEDTLPASDFPSQQSTSGYVKNLLADAMADDAAQLRMNSPVSLESRSEMGLRLGSEQTSGHTSGDELETTTSSDIEIISSPNGEGSSSTASRHSPAKLVHRGPHGHVDILKFPGKMKGHQREPSEASSGGSDDSQGSDMDRLLKRLSEVSELLEVRETKLLALSRSHAELQERHQELRSQLESAQQSRISESRSLNEASEEFTRRLSALERKFQQAIRDKDVLQKQLEQNKSERVNELSERVGERDETIRELRTEGEKLSRQLLQQSNLIKKLRAKEKESDSIIKTLREQVESLTGEIERLKRSLAAKEDVERSQIEAVHQLTARVKKLEGELTTVRDQKDELQRKAEEAQAALENSTKELSASREREQDADQRVRDATQSAEEGARAELEAALNAAQQHKRQIMAQMDRMRDQLTQAEALHSKRESELLERLEGAELRSEQLSQQLSEASRPLLRQLQALQASCKTQQGAWERQERALTDALSEAQAQVVQMSEAERTSREELLTLRSKVSTLESKLTAASQSSTSNQEQSVHLQSQLEKINDLFEESKMMYEAQLSDLKRQVSSLDHQISVERAAIEAEKRKNSQLQEQLTDRHSERMREREAEGGKRESPLVAMSGHSSPTISFGRDSLSESVSSLAWPVFTDDTFETVSAAGRNVYESVRLSHTTSLIEGLQSQLKLREGEVQQLQWELSRREAQRCALTAELSGLAARAEDQEARLTSSLEAQETLTSQLSTLRTEYDALLQLYGEKLEESQELRLDLQDVKDMYKAQIDQLLKKEENAQKRVQHEDSEDQNAG